MLERFKQEKNQSIMWIIIHGEIKIAMVGILRKKGREKSSKNHAGSCGI
jgi:hypothetical protein